MVSGGLLDQITVVAAGGQHSLALRDDGTVWSWGTNEYGQLGHGHTTDVSYAVQITTDASGDPFEDVVYVDAGYEHSLALKADGTVWTWGRNNYGQLGNGGQGTSIARPVQVVDGVGEPFTNVVSIAAGDRHNLALKAEVDLDNFTTISSLWSWGYNSNGQLGNGNTSNKTTPVQVLDSSGIGVEEVIGMQASRDHNWLIKTDGTIGSWGDNDYGQLGDGNTLGKRHTVQVIAENGSPITIDPEAENVGFSVGRQYSLLVKDDRVWIWGNNLNTSIEDVNPYPLELLDIDSSTPVNAVSGATFQSSQDSSASAVIKDDGTVLMWGSNVGGELGNGTTQPRITPDLVLDSSGQPFSQVDSVGIFYGGRVRADNGPENGFWSIALKDDGGLWLWGLDDYNDTTPTVYPKQVLDTSGQPLNNIVKFDTDDLFTEGLALAADGSVWGFTINYVWEAIAAPAANENKIIDIAVGSDGNIGYYPHHLALKEDGTVWAWGYSTGNNNSTGQLGDGTTEAKYVPVQVIDESNQPIINIIQILARSGFSMALKDDGTVWTWGANDYGRLGQQSSDRSYPYAKQVVDGSGQILTNVVDITAGPFHILATKNDGSVWAWGNNASGELGSGIVAIVKKSLMPCKWLMILEFL